MKRYLIAGLLVAGLMLVGVSCKSMCCPKKAAAAEQAGLEKVDSSLIDSAGYDAASKTLTVVFATTKETYVYKNVPQKVYDAMMKAESKGAYFTKNIKNKYEFEKK